MFFVIGFLVGSLAGGFLVFLWGRWVINRLMVSLTIAVGTSKGLVTHFFMVDNGTDLDERQEKEVEHRKKTIFRPLDDLIHNPTKVIKDDAKLFRKLEL